MRKALLALLLSIITFNYALGEEAPKVTTLSLTTKGQASAPADLAFINFSIEGENENAVDAEKIFKKRSSILISDLALPLASGITEITSCALIAGTSDITFKNQSSTSVIYQQRYSIIIRHYTKEDNKAIAKLVDQLAVLGLADEITVGYGIEDPDSIKNRAYRLALDSAKKRAKAIAACLDKATIETVQIKDNSAPETITNSSKANLNCSTTQVLAVADLTVEFVIK